MPDGVTSQHSIRNERQLKRAIPYMYDLKQLFLFFCFNLKYSIVCQRKGEKINRMTRRKCSGICEPQRKKKIRESNSHFKLRLFKSLFAIND